MVGKEKPIRRYYPGSVLLSDHIEKLVKEGWLIVPDPKTREQTFDKNQLKRAKYDMRLGKAYYKAGNYGNLDDSNPLLEIAPYELVFVESYEVFKIPENVVAVYDLRVSGCLGGLGLQTGLQLDPEYYGKGFCPLFNFSDTKLTLKYKDHLASVQFLYTTPLTLQAKQIEPFDKRKSGLLSLSQVLPDTPRGSGLGKLWESLQAFDSASTRLHTRIDTMVSAVFEAMAIMITALGVIVAVMAVILTSDFKLEPAHIVIGIAIFLVVAFGVFALIRRIMRKISEGK